MTSLGSHRIAGLIVSLSALLVAACADTQREPRPVCDFEAYEIALQNPPTGEVLVPPSPGTITDMPLNTVNITDVAITNKVIVQATNASRTETGQVEVWARIVNCTDFTLHVEGRTNFLTATQAPAEPVTAWNRVILPARSISTYSAKSIAGERVATYLIELREGK